MAEVTVKAFVLARLLELARDGLSADSFAKLEADVGLTLKSVKLAFFKAHPVSVQNKLEDNIAKALWNRTDDQAFHQFGKMNFDTFATSTIGKATIAMTGRNPRRFMKASIRLMSTVMTGMKIEITDLGERKFSFRFFNNPYRPLGWQGIIDAAMEHCGVTHTVRTILHGGEDTEYIIQWEME